MHPLIAINRQRRAIAGHELWIIYRVTDGLRNYIGSTKRTLEERWHEHCRYAELNYSEDHILYQAIRDLGPDKFRLSIISEAFSEAEARKKEMKYIKEYKADLNEVPPLKIGPLPMVKMLLVALALTVNLSAAASAQGFNPAPQFPPPPNTGGYRMQATPLYQSPAYQPPQPSYGVVIGTPMGNGFSHFSARGFSANCINFSGFVTCR